MSSWAAPCTRSDDSADALASFDRAIAQAPELAPAHANRADVLSKIGRNAEALDSYDRALALAPDSVADWMNRGVALVALNRHDEAVLSFDRGFALDPDFAQADDFRAPRLIVKAAHLRLDEFGGGDGTASGHGQSRKTA